MTLATVDHQASGMSTNPVGHERTRPLQGMKAICAYMGKSESTILKYIKCEGLPAAKIGGAWVSDEGRIDDWRLNRIG